MADPQVDEDQLVEAVRARARGTRTLAELWQGYAVSSRALGRIDADLGKGFDASLKLARARVRDAAAALLLSQEPAEAAVVMMHNAAAHEVRRPPMIDYDAAAVEYTIARTWQACAWTVNPELPEVQARWDG
jgi:hypothetical protein